MQQLSQNDKIHKCKFCSRSHQWQLQQIRSKVGELTLRIPEKEKLKIQDCLKKCSTLYFALIAEYYDKQQFGGLEALKRQMDQLGKQNQDIFSYVYKVVQEYQQGHISFFHKIIVGHEKISLELIKRGLGKLKWLESKNIIKFDNQERSQVLGFYSRNDSPQLQKQISRAMVLGVEDLIEPTDFWPSEANQLKIRILKKFQSMQKSYSKKFADSSILTYWRGNQMFGTNSDEQSLFIFSGEFGRTEESSTFQCMDEYDKICRSIECEDRYLFKKYERLVGWFVFLDIVVGDLACNPCSMVDYLVQSLVPMNVRRNNKSIERTQFVDRMTEIIMCYYRNREQDSLGLNIKLYRIFEILFKDLPKNQIPKRIRGGIQFIVEVIKKIEKMYGQLL